MRKILPVLLLVFLSGCLTRAYVAEQERRDIDMDGNRGYLSGTPPEVKEYRLGKTRKVAVFEVELGSHSPRRKSSSQAAEEMPAYTDEDDSYTQSDAYSEDATPPEDTQPDCSTYVVKKNDTLQKISYKFYGTTKKWMKLYEENKDTLSGPNKIYPGMKLRIPAAK